MQSSIVRWNALTTCRMCRMVGTFKIKTRCRLSASKDPTGDRPTGMLSVGQVVQITDAVTLLDGSMRFNCAQGWFNCSTEFMVLSDTSDLSIGDTKHILKDKPVAGALAALDFDEADRDEARKLPSRKKSGRGKPTRKAVKILSAEGGT